MDGSGGRDGESYLIPKHEKTPYAMKLRKIVYQPRPGVFDDLSPSQIVAIPNKVYRTNRFHRLMDQIPTGTALCSSLFSQYNCVIRRPDAVAHSVPFISLR